MYWKAYISVESFIPDFLQCFCYNFQIRRNFEISVQFFLDTEKNIRTPIYSRLKKFEDDVSLDPLWWKKGISDYNSRFAWNKMKKKTVK